MKNALAIVPVALLSAACSPMLYSAGGASPAA